jgi:hypothetical protein
MCEDTWVHCSCTAGDIHMYSKWSVESVYPESQAFPESCLIHATITLYVWEVSGDGPWRKAVEIKVAVVTSEYLSCSWPQDVKSKTKMLLKFPGAARWPSPVPSIEELAWSQREWLWGYPGSSNSGMMTKYPWPVPPTIPKALCQSQDFGCLFWQCQSVPKGWGTTHKKTTPVSTEADSKPMIHTFPFISFPSGEVPAHNCVRAPWATSYKNICYRAT